jgi:hypothetical protein
MFMPVRSHGLDSQLRMSWSLSMLKYFRCEVIVCFSWYLWNCWPSLLKHVFSHLLMVVYRPETTKLYVFKRNATKYQKHMQKWGRNGTFMTMTLTVTGKVWEMDCGATFSLFPSYNAPFDILLHSSWIHIILLSLDGKQPSIND